MAQYERWDHREEPYHVWAYKHYRQYEVEATNVEDFLKRYYKPERIASMLNGYPDYFETMQESYTQELLANGFCFITHHGSITGHTVAYYGGE